MAARQVSSGEGPQYAGRTSVQSGHNGTVSLQRQRLSLQVDDVPSSACLVHVLHMHYLELGACLATRGEVSPRRSTDG
jgi:hypothetical protein